MLFENRNFCIQCWNFDYFAGASEPSECFTQYLYMNFQRFPKFSEFLELQKYDVNSDLYRIICFRQILFLLHSLLILMNLWIVSVGMSHGEVGVQYHYANIKYESIYNK